MRDWVRDLNEQNSVLIQTVDEMEKEAEEKIRILQTKIQRSTQMVMQHMEIIQGYEKQVQDLLEHQAASDQEFEVSDPVVINKQTAACGRYNM